MSRKGAQFQARRRLSQKMGYFDLPARLVPLHSAFYVLNPSLQFEASVQVLISEISVQDEICLAAILFCYYSLMSSPIQFLRENLIVVNCEVTTESEGTV